MAQESRRFTSFHVFSRKLTMWIVCAWMWNCECLCEPFMVSFLILLLPWFTGRSFVPFNRALEFCTLQLLSSPKNLYSFIISSFICVKNEYKSIVEPSIFNVSPLWLDHGCHLTGKQFVELFEIFGVTALLIIPAIFLIPYLHYI